jgi:hypothetical protein
MSWLEDFRNKPKPEKVQKPIAPLPKAEKPIPVPTAQVPKKPRTETPVSIPPSANTYADGSPKPPPKKPKDKPKPFVKKPVPPFTSYETVKAICGHDVQFGLWPDKQDKFRKERRLKLTEKKCPECRAADNKVREAEEQKRREEKAARIAANPPVPQNPPGTKKKWRNSNKARLYARLPHKSEFHVSYDAEKVLWSGRLSIPCGDLVLSFEASNSSVFWLLSQLDDLYRKSLEPAGENKLDPTPTK